MASPAEPAGADGRSVALTVVVPWTATGDDDRWAALAWVLQRWATDLPAATVVVAEMATTGEWVKADAVMPAVDAAAPGVIVLADADVWCSGTAEAVSAVREGCSWAVPHRYVRRLTREASRAVYGGVRFEDLPATALAERAYIGVPGGGLMVTTRDRLLRVPLDSRFRGWGGEDQALGYAFRAIFREPWRGEAPLWHLWHPPQPRADRRWGNLTSEALRLRYLAAEFDPTVMATILAEAREAATWHSR